MSVLRSLTARDLQPKLQPFVSKVLSSTRAPSCVKIGIAVSGGPDSMALAYLLSKLKHEELPFPIEPHAFIIDHGARPGSKNEARRVSHHLDKLGLSSQILQIPWKSEEEPSHMFNFETQAREGRYAVLSRALKAGSIDHLFLGHHLDDQIELLLYRLIRNQYVKLPALQGMQAVAAIPSAISGPNAQLLESSLQNHDNLSARKKQGLLRSDGPLVLSSSHTHMYRPLLDFPKQVLINTCEDNKIHYVTDQTNFDPSLTPRNAIRFMRSNFLLPRALQEESIVALQSKAVVRVTGVRARAREWMRSIRMVSLDTRAGLLKVEIPQSYRTLAQTDPDVAATILASLVNVVNPVPVPQQNFVSSAPATRSLAQLLQNPPRRAERTPITGVFSTEKVVIQTLDGASWSEVTFSRRPFTRAETDKAKIDLRTLASGDGIDPTGRVLSKWVCWDHRYWLRVTLADQDDLEFMQIRPYCETDVANVRSRLGHRQFEFDASLTKTCPGKVRFTLPVLTFKDKVVAFPSLGVTIPYIKKGGQRLAFQWQIRFKPVDNDYQGRLGHIFSTPRGLA